MNMNEISVNTVDMHCDTISRLFNLRAGGRPESLRRNSGHVDLERMAQSGYLLQNFALFVAMSPDKDPWEEVCALYEVYKEEMAKNTDIIAPVYKFQDIEDNRKKGKLSSLLTVEEGGVCKGELTKLEKLYEMGVRMLTLTWNFPNELGFPNLNMSKKPVDRKNFLYVPDTVNGLTERGKEFVAHMEQLGIIPDVSHLSDAGFWDVVNVTKKPFVASHSDARAVCRCVRNLNDDMIRKLSERGGVMGLNFCADFLEEVAEGEKNPGTIEAVVRHAKHIANVGGCEVLGIGSDFDGIETHEELPGAQSMGRLWEALKKSGFSESELDKIYSGNVLRVYRDCLV